MPLPRANERARESRVSKIIDDLCVYLECSDLRVSRAVRRGVILACLPWSVQTVLDLKTAEGVRWENGKSFDHGLVPEWRNTLVFVRLPNAPETDPFLELFPSETFSPSKLVSGVFSGLARDVSGYCRSCRFGIYDDGRIDASPWTTYVRTGERGEWHDPFAEMIPIGGGRQCGRDGANVRTGGERVIGQGNRTLVCTLFQHLGGGAAHVPMFGQLFAWALPKVWSVEFSLTEETSLVALTSVRGVAGMFRMRDKTEWRDRRAALLHWVREHTRVISRAAGDEPLEAEVRGHLRGARKFDWFGLKCEIAPPERLRKKIDG